MIRAEVISSNPMAETIYLAVVERRGDRHAVVSEISTTGTVMQAHAEATEPVPLVIDIEVARALLDALARHFGGTGDTRQLRKDYDHERSRVDKLTDAVIRGFDRSAGGA